MIYLSAEVISGLGEDTFWTWFKREFPASKFDQPTRLAQEDVVLTCSTKGFVNCAGKSIALLWELYPEMKAFCHSDQWDTRLNAIYECARFSTYRTVASSLAVSYYQQFGTVDVLPIGVDTDLFGPMPEKMAIRDKYDIPRNREVGIWCGTIHPMRGFDALQEYASLNPDIYWVIVWKGDAEANYMPGASHFVNMSQAALCELFNAADFFLSCGRLRPFYMVEWEAMACNLKMRVLGNMSKDFTPSENPRDDIFRLKWDRTSVKRLWEDYLKWRGVTW